MLQGILAFGLEFFTGVHCALLAKLTTILIQIVMLSTSVNPCSCGLKVLSYRVMLICSVKGKKHELLRVQKVKALERF